MRNTLVQLGVLSALILAGCEERDTIRVVPDRQGHSRATMDSAPATANTRVPGSGEQVHTVKAGDTLAGIAKTYAVELAWLIKRNDLSPNKPLQAGQQLIVPRR
jgi:LysM repeat protein